MRRPLGWLSLGGELGDPSTIAGPVSSILTVSFGERQHVVTLAGGAVAKITCPAAELLNAIATAFEEVSRG